MAPGAPAAPVPPELQGVADAANAQATAAEDVGAANAAAADAKAQAEADARVQHQLEAQEAADLRAAHAQAAQAAEDRTQKALVAARDAKIPDFWAGREGARTSAALAVGIGGFAAGLLGSSKNGAADIIQNNVDSYYRREKEKIDNLYKYAEGQGKAQDDLRMRQAAELAELQVQHGATNLAIADHINEIVAASQGRINIAEANAIKAKVLEEGQKSILAGRKTLAEIAYLGARGQKLARAGAGGGGGAVQSAAVTLATEIEEAKKSGKPMSYAQMAARATELKIPLDAKAGRVSLKTVIADSGTLAGQALKENAAELKLTEADEARAVRDPKTGEIKGLAASSREVPTLRKLLINYDQGIESLKEMLADQRFLNSVPKGSRWDNAVLAIAATTTAGATDANVKHEAGTLLDVAGRVDKEAIARKIRDLETRRDQFYRTLSPVKAAPGMEGASAGNDRKAKAKALLDDPARASKLTPEEKAKLEKFVNG
jgi:hypothetical protein